MCFVNSRAIFMARSWYFVILFCSFLLTLASLEIAISVIQKSRQEAYRLEGRQRANVHFSACFLLSVSLFSRLRAAYLLIWAAVLLGGCRMVVQTVEQSGGEAGWWTRGGGEVRS